MFEQARQSCDRLKRPADPGLARVLEVVGCEGFLDLRDLGATACVADVAEGAWRVEARRRWGDVERGDYRTWKRLLENLGSRPLGCPSAVGHVVRDLRLRSVLPAGALASTLRAALPRARRAVTLYLASDDFRRVAGAGADAVVDDVVSRSLQRCARRSASVEACLRASLGELPFLPIACGRGTDALIRALAKLYAATHRDGVVDPYILFYSLIILNTDLHNPRVRSKITENAYVASLRRTAIEGVAEADARALYRSIKRRPLSCGAGPAAGGPGVLRLCRAFAGAAISTAVSVSLGSSGRPPYTAGHVPDYRPHTAVALGCFATTFLFFLATADG